MDVCGGGILGTFVNDKEKDESQHEYKFGRGTNKTCIWVRYDSGVTKKVRALNSRIATVSSSPISLDMLMWNLSYYAKHISKTAKESRE
jgi:hypothetical protein